MCVPYIERWQINWNRLGNNWRRHPLKWTHTTLKQLKHIELTHNNAPDLRSDSVMMMMLI